MSGALIALNGSYLGVIVAITNTTVTDSQIGSPASATYQLLNTGIWQGVNGSGVSSSGNWITPQTGMSNYEAQATISSGPTGLGTATGSYGTWLNLGTTRSWGCDNGAGNGNSQLVISVSIRPAGGGTTLTTATITLRANAN